MKLIFILLLSALGYALAQAPLGEITLTVPRGIQVNVVPDTNSSAPMPPLPIPPSEARMRAYSAEIREAAQRARGQSAPWSQRFSVVKVEEDARARPDDEGVNVFGTNFVVTLMPVNAETNAPVVWGPVKARTIRLITTRPTKKGDEFILFPD